MVNPYNMMYLYQQPVIREPVAPQGAMPPPYDAELHKEVKMHELYDLNEMLCKELKEYGKKDKLDMASLEAVDKLSESMWRICRTCQACLMMALPTPMEEE